MTNEQSGVPMGRHAQKQPPVNQVASQLSQSLPVVNIEETAPQYTGNPVITLDHVTKIYEAQPNNPALSRYIAAHFPWRIRVLGRSFWFWQVYLYQLAYPPDQANQGQDLYRR